MGSCTRFCTRINQFWGFANEADFHMATLQVVRMKNAKPSPWGKRQREYKGGCTGKVRFESRESAAPVLLKIQEKEAHLKKEMHSYRCGHCQKWHIGTKRIME